MSYAVVCAPADVSIDLAQFAPLDAACPHVRTAVDEVATAAGVPRRVLLGGEPTAAGDVPRVKLVSMSLLAVMAGVVRRLESERGEAPAWAGGVSLGELVAVVAAGSLTLRSATRLLVERPEGTHDGPESVAFVFLPAPHGVDTLPPVADVWPSVDYGPVAGGAGRMVMLSGTRAGLAQLAERSTWDVDVLPPELCSSAYHSPLREHARGAVDEVLRVETVATPRLPVLSCVPGLGACTDAEAVTATLSRSETEALAVPLLVAAADRAPVDEIVCVGPYLRSMELPFTSPVTYLDEVSGYGSARLAGAGA